MLIGVIVLAGVMYLGLMSQADNALEMMSGGTVMSPFVIAT